MPDCPLRILVTIAHYYRPDRKGQYGSTGKAIQPRIDGLEATISALHQNFGPSQGCLHHTGRDTHPSNDARFAKLDVVVCVSGNEHVLSKIKLPHWSLKAFQTAMDPLKIGYGCHRFLKESLGLYDFYCFLEDDIVINDVDFFEKIRWFNEEFGNDALLQPNRYEVSMTKEPCKVYVDGGMRPSRTMDQQDINDAPVLRGRCYNRPIVFRRAINPHSGCFFLNQTQMEKFVAAPHFMDLSDDFIGPLESAATRGIMKSFKVYKPAQENASFLEVKHHQSRYQQMIGNAFGHTPGMADRLALTHGPIAALQAGGIKPDPRSTHNRSTHRGRYLVDDLPSTDQQ